MSNQENESKISYELKEISIGKIKKPIIVLLECEDRIRFQIGIVQFPDFSSDGDQDSLKKRKKLKWSYFIRLTSTSGTVVYLDPIEAISLLNNLEEAKKKAYQILMNWYR